MLFNTIEFVILFTVVCSTLVLFKIRQFQIVFLLFSSYFFFYFTSNYLIILLLFTTIWNFYLAKAISNSKNKVKRKYILIINLVGSLGLLGLFKYADFGIEQFNNLAHHVGLSEIPYLNLILPIGISFYTFQALSYTIDVYRSKLTPSKSFLEFAFFVAFFPQLVAGPILRANDFLPQLREKMNISATSLRQALIHNSNLKLGVTIMAFGFMKKMFIADNIAPLVNEVFKFPIGYDSFTIIIATIAFGTQIYADFSGYTDIAIGAALILGFKIPANFNKPFFATSPSDFWTRWHISLSTWVRDYCYFPLVFRLRNYDLGIIFSIMFSFMLIGLWHGAGWNFLIVGILHGSYIAGHTIIRKKFPIVSKLKFFKSKLGIIVSILITQYLVFLAFIPFRVQSVEHMLYVFEKFIIIDFQTSNILPFVLSHKLPISFMILFFVFHFIAYKRDNIVENISKLRLRYWIIILLGVLSSIVFFYDGNPVDFIYFRF